MNNQLGMIVGWCVLVAFLLISYAAMIGLFGMLSRRLNDKTDGSDNDGK